MGVLTYSVNLQLKAYKREFDYSYSFGVFPTVELLAKRPQNVVKVLCRVAGGEERGCQEDKGDVPQAQRSVRRE